MLKNKKWFTISALAAAVLVVGLVSFFVINGTVSADELPPEDPAAILPGEGFGRGPAGRGGQRLQSDNLVFLQSIADQSGIALETLQTAVENQQRLETVLSDAGFSAEEMRSMFHTAQVAVIDANVADGSLTDEQAATLKQRLADAIARRAEAQANHGAINELWQKTLSEKLGLSIEEMQSLFGETRDEVIQQAMEQGLLTEEQARQWLENHDSEMPFFGGRRNRQMPGGMGRPGADDSNLRGMPFGDTEF